MIYGVCIQFFVDMFLNYFIHFEKTKNKEKKDLEKNNLNL